ncbi:MAG: hypothetical protein GX259_07630 [Bacteroidales bacterium]|mgnify:CR=1 FL=1|nr:hypothetical protein [Bacteroidales bacterium]
MISKIKNLVIAVFVLFSTTSTAQNILKNSQISGNFQTDFQYYIPDSVIGADTVPERLLSNGYLNLLFTNGNFSAGVRYENYNNVMLGFDPRYKGSGIPYRFAQYSHKDFDITVGNYYEQFGTGMLLRSYEERSLGIDNSIDGIRLKYKPYNGIYLKGLIGQQRFFFDKGAGIVRGLDAEMNINELFSKLSSSKLRATFGGSFVSKYQPDRDPIYKLPENVGGFAARTTLIYKNILFTGEYAYKVNDPSAINNYIYKPGEALFTSISYSKKGFGVTLNAKRIDNMNFRSDRTATGNVLTINYLPALSKPHTYTLLAFYPYASQPNGETAFQGIINYKIKKNTLLGGKYGTDIAINYSRANAIDMQKINDSTAIMQRGTLGYKSNFFSVGDEVYHEDANIEISHKFNKKLKAIFTWAYITYNSLIIEGHGDTYYCHIGIADITYRLNSKNAIRFELQHLLTKQDDKNWAMALIEYSIAPKWFFMISDNYNYGNPVNDKKTHYYSSGFGYTYNSSRIAITYGRQRDGIICVGGVCRYVPASNGLLVTITSNF